MASIFTKIIAGEIPARLLWEDDHCVAFLDVRPLAPGHTLVVPIAEVDHWMDLNVETARHLMDVAHRIGNAQRTVFSPARVGLMIAGFEVPHTHLHVVPMNSMAQLDFSNAMTDPQPADLDRHAEELRAALAAQDHTDGDAR